MYRRVLFTAALLVSLPAWAQDAVDVAQPWARATPGHATTGAVYVTLTNHAASDELTGISTPVAGMAMLHETVQQNGVARMLMRDSVALPSHQAVTFRPGGLHIMLTGLKEPLKQGSHFPVTFTFAHAAPVTVDVPIMAPGAAGPDAAAAGHDMSGMKMD